MSCGRGYQSRSWICEKNDNKVCDTQKRDCVSKTPCAGEANFLLL